MTSKAEPVRRGRPRDESRRLAILEVANHLFRVSGYDAVTMEAIAAGAAVSKATIYRWWPNKSAVLLDSVVRNMTPLDEYRDARTWRDKFVQQLNDTARRLTSEEGAPLLALIAAKQTDQQLAQEFMERYTVPRRVRLIALLKEGVRKGELRPIANYDDFIDMVYGPIYYRILMTRAPVDEAFVSAVVDHAGL